MRSARSILCIVSFGVLMLGLLTFVAPQGADAHCRDGIARFGNYGSYGDEVGQAGTCDGDGKYRGAVAENFPYQPDGHCAVARNFSSPTGWTWQGYSCRNDSDWVNYYWRPNDTTGRFKMCKGWSTSRCASSLFANTM